MDNLLLVRLSVALVWAYQGLWCKLLGKTPHHEVIVGSVPFLGIAQARAMVAVLGTLECLLAVWVLSGQWGFASAVTQTILLVTMNAGGLLWGRRMIPDPGGMLFHNFAFVLLAWIAAGEFHLYAASH